MQKTNQSQRATNKSHNKYSLDHDLQQRFGLSGKVFPLDTSLTSPYYPCIVSFLNKKNQMATVYRQ